MTTIRSRSLVSLVFPLALTLVLSGCAGNPFRSALNDPAPVAARPATIRFDNQGRQYVHVYLVGESREWLLGRVEPGARVTLRIPEGAMTNDTRSMQLAVLAGDRVTMRAALNPGAALTILQPAVQLVAQKWTFTQTLANGQATTALMGRAQ
jgi:hypothetical protein